MAWIMPDKRRCPSCGYMDRILVTRAREAELYRLSCGWCAYLSDRDEAHPVFFKLWDAPDYEVGAVLELSGVPHWLGRRYVESVPIRVLNNGSTALVAERKNIA